MRGHDHGDGVGGDGVPIMKVRLEKCVVVVVMVLVGMV